MPHPFIGQSVSLMLNRRVQQVDYLLVGVLASSSFRGVYCLTACYSVNQAAVKRGDFKPNTFILMGEVCVERDVVSAMIRSDALHSRLRAAAANDTDKNNKNNNHKNEKERGHEPGDVCEEDQQG